MTSFILAVDHRASLRRWLGGRGVPAETVDAHARRLKLLCVEALGSVTASLGPDETPMLLLDEEYGADAIPAARTRGLRFIVPAEISGEPEFHFEHGERFAAAITARDPFAVKALVRYHPDADRAANRRSGERLLRLQGFLDASGRPFMLELLVPPTAAQAADSRIDFDRDVRPALTVAAIAELAELGLAPTWWKLEGNADPDAARAVAVAAATASRRGSLVLGRGQDRAAVLRWVQVAAATPGVDGFAVGRTLWMDTYAGLLAGERDEAGVVAQIGAAYLDIVAAFREARHGRDGPGGDGGARRPGVDAHG